jgi:hypothetical protein
MMGLGGVAIQSSTGFHQKLAFYFFVSQDKIRPVNDPIILPPKNWLALTLDSIRAASYLYIYLRLIIQTNLKNSLPK